MQLIVETENTLDIDKTMSAVEDIHNNKVESLDISEKKCNANKKVIEINKNAEEEESKQTSSGNDELDKMSNVDLSIIIHNQNNSPEVKDAQREESHHHNSENETNGFDTIKLINVSTTMLEEEEEEEEYEDDLIRIDETPYNAIPESENQTGDHLRNNDETMHSAEKLSNVELDKHQTVEEVNDKDDDDIEVIESQDNLIQCEEKINQPSHEIQDDVELVDDSDCAIVSSDDLSESTFQEDKDDFEDVKKLEDLVLLPEKAKEPLVQNKELELMDIPIETEHFSENTVDIPMEICNHDIVEEGMEVENETDTPIKEDGSVQNENNVDAVEKSLQCKNIIDLVPEESKEMPVQVEDETDKIKKETDAVMITEKDVMSLDDIDVSETKNNANQIGEKLLEDDIGENGDEKHTDENDEDNVVHEKDPAKVIQEKKEDQLFNKVEDKVLSENNEDKLLDEKDEVKVIKEKDEDQPNEKYEDKVLPKQNEDKHKDDRNKVKLIQKKNEHELLNNKYDDKNIQQMDEDDLLNEKDEDKVIQEKDEDQLLNKKDDDKVIVQQKDEDKLLNEQDEDKVIQETDENQPLNKKDDDKVIQQKDEEELLNEKDEDKVTHEEEENKDLDANDQVKVLQKNYENKVNEKDENQLLEKREELLDEDKLTEEKEEPQLSKEDKLLESKGEDELTEEKKADRLKMDEDKELALKDKDSSIDQNSDEPTINSTESTNQSVNNGVVSSIKEVAANEIQSTENVETLLSNDTTETIKCDALQTLNAKEVGSTICTKDDKMDVEAALEEQKAVSSELNNEMEVEEVPEETEHNKEAVSEIITNKSAPVKNIIDEPFKLSNTLDILSDDDEESPTPVPAKMESPAPELPPNGSPKASDETEKQCIDIEDDDDIMLVDEDADKETTAELGIKHKEQISVESDINTDSETGEKTVIETSNLPQTADEKDTPLPVTETQEKTPETTIDRPDKTLMPLVQDNIAKKKLGDMTRDELEEFCILKIIEGVVDRSSLTDIKNKLKSMTQTLDEYRRKVMMLTKQHRDLQVVLKSVQEEQKKGKKDPPITPLKITRSVGMQVFMEKTNPRKKGQPNNNNKTPNTPQTKNSNVRQKQPNQQIPVPRLVPASPALKTPSTIPQVNQINMQNKNANLSNGALKNPTPSAKAEKRQFSKVASSSVTVDLTDDEPPAKMPGGPKTSPAPPVRLVPSQSLMAPQRQAFGTNVNSPRKVYIPISGPQGQSLRPGQTIMLKTVPAPGIRARAPAPRPDQNAAVRMNRTSARHPAPLPLPMKQYQPPNWKTLPPPPDLKLSKVENGIVISWKIDGIPEDSYEEIASYQLFAYQETSLPPNTALWKKIGDVKALPLPMACTLTQFMAGFKYYFAVRAVDIRSRLGPFSLPGSILLLSKNV